MPSQYCCINWGIGFAKFKTHIRPLFLYELFHFIICLYNGRQLYSITLSPFLYELLLLKVLSILLYVYRMSSSFTAQTHPPFLYELLLLKDLSKLLYVYRVSDSSFTAQTRPPFLYELLLLKFLSILLYVLEWPTAKYLDTQPVTSTTTPTVSPVTSPVGKMSKPSVSVRTAISSYVPNATPSMDV